MKKPSLLARLQLLKSDVEFKEIALLLALALLFAIAGMTVCGASAAGRLEVFTLAMILVPRPTRARKNPGRVWRGQFIAGTETRDCPECRTLTQGPTDFKPVFCGTGIFAISLLLSRYSMRGVVVN